MKRASGHRPLAVLLCLGVVSASFPAPTLMAQAVGKVSGAPPSLGRIGVVSSAGSVGNPLISAGQNVPLAAAVASPPLLAPAYAGLSRDELSRTPGLEILAVQVSARALDSALPDPEHRVVAERVRGALRHVLADEELLSFLRDPAVDGLRPGERAEALIERYERKYGALPSSTVRGRMIDELSRPSAEAANGIYFEARPGLRLPETPMDLLSLQASGLAYGRYFTELRERSRRLYARLFPELAADFPIAFRFRPAAERNATQTRPDAKGIHVITFFGPDYTTHATENDLVESDLNVPGLPPLVLPRKIDNLVTFFHEMAHGVFDRTVPIPDMYRRDPNSGFFALTEGFAVMLELIMIDRLVAARAEFGLDDADVSALLASKRRRVEILRRVPNHLTEGTFYFWHRIYKREGMAGMLRFLQSLDPARVGAINRSSIEYRLIQGNPELFESFLTKDADVRPREAFLALHRAIQGKPLADDERAKAADFLSRVSRSALSRFYSRVLGPGRPAGSATPPEVVSLVSRLASVDPRASRLLAERIRSWMRKTPTAAPNAVPVALNAGPASVDFVSRDRAFSGSREIERGSVELADGTPERMARVRARLRRRGDGTEAAAVKRAEERVRLRMNAAVPNRGAWDRLDEGRRFDLYDDLLRLLRLRGVLAENALYPVIGADYLPARWSRIYGLNWVDYKGLFKKMARLAGRAAFARRLDQPRRVRFEAITSVFHAEALAGALKRAPRSGPRTLLLKYAGGYNADWAIARARAGEYPGFDTNGLMRYSDWLKTMARDALVVGDTVVILGEDARASRFFAASRSFERVPLEVPVLSKVPADASVFHSWGSRHSSSQALYFPRSIAVYRKIAELE